LLALLPKAMPRMALTDTAVQKLKRPERSERT